MARNETPPEDIKDFLRSPEDLARVLDRRGREQQVRETLEKASQNPNFASAMQALHALPAEDPPKAVQPSERAEYNPAKTIPPRTRRDTLELQPKLVVRDDVLDSRHRPTEKIQRVAVDALLPAVRSESTAVPVVESPREEESQTREQPIVGTYPTLEGLGHLGAQGGGAREVVRVERKGSVDTAALGAMKTEEMSAATSKTEPVAVSPDASELAKESAEKAPIAVGIEPPERQPAPSPPSTEPEPIPVVAARPRSKRGGLVLLAAAFAVIAIGAMVLWSARAADPTEPAAPSARVPAPTATHPLLAPRAEPSGSPPVAATSAESREETATAPTASLSRPSARPPTAPRTASTPVSPVSSTPAPAPIKTSDRLFGTEPR